MDYHIFINDHINDLNLDAALALLSEQRREQALRFKHEFGRRTCAAAYLLLCKGLREIYGIIEKPIFEFGVHGKPFIVGHPDIHFNISHCKEAVVCVISNRPIGVDVESIREYKDSLIQYTMNDEEIQQIKQAEHPDIAFTRLWTMKEARLKLTGEGINNNMKNVLDESFNITTIVSPDMRYVYSVCMAY